ncbi:ABC transporter transmembrane domain-containing protein [Pseudonocardia acidicola]|uniref:ABC transporter ATP-binding protein n=1 Tax=Pseudonocardia acidicola TaxID=2724939 RepID=A0ABX1SBZ5_9PSEU|nr:ABC transporter ATP-binding protein [Pseudonocardia acidicola]
MTLTPAGRSGPIVGTTRAATLVLRRFWPLARPDRATLAAATLLLVLAAAADTVAVRMFSDIVDGAVSDGSLNAYWGPAALWLATAVAGGVATFAGSYLTARAAENFLLRLRDQAFGHLQRLSPDFFAHHPLGDLVSRLTGDIEVIEELVSSGVVQVLASVTTVLFFAGAAFFIRWDLALAILVLLPLLLIATRRFSARIRTLSQSERETNGTISTVVEEGIANVALIQAYGTERREADRLHLEGRRWLHARLAQTRLAALYAPLTDLFETIGILAVLGVGAWEISAHRLTIGGLVGFATYLGFLYGPLHRLGDLMLSVTAARAAGDRLSEILDAVPAVADHPAALTGPARSGLVEFDRVVFGYPGAEGPSLRGVSLRAEPGRLLLVTGPSGAGKSTLARLLLRFYDPHAGRITLDGADLRDISLAALRTSVTLLPQETAVLDGTVADNIAYGSPGAPPAAIRAAARAVGADEFICRLPQGYLTPLGHRGPQLSGGQRQRIAFARAVLRGAPVLVLDEPTTGLDAASVAALAPALRSLARGRTTIVITHDLALAPMADRIAVLDRGTVIEHGTHAQLLAAGGLYRRLFQGGGQGTAPSPWRSAVEDTARHAQPERAGAR